MSDVKLGLWPVAGIVVTAVSATAAVCLIVVGAFPESSEASAAQNGPTPEEAAETGFFSGRLWSSYSTALMPDGTPTLALSTIITAPEEWDIVGMDGTLSVIRDGVVLRSFNYSDRRRDERPGKYQIYQVMEYDDSNPAHRAMRYGPQDQFGDSEYTMRLAATHVVFADGSVKTYDR